MNFNNEIPKEMINYGIRRNFIKNTNIYHLNSNLTSCYLILSGIVKIYIDHDNGRRSILDFAGKNDWIGELSLFYAETDIKENKVLQDVECLEFNLEELRKLCKENAKISYYFASYISYKLLSRSYRMSESLNYSLEKRLATFILQYNKNGIYDIPHTDVSEYLNVSYRHVLHIIKQFREFGILEKTKNKGYTIKNLEKLEKFKNK